MKCFFYNVWNKSFAKRNIDLRIWNLTKQLFFNDDCFEKKNITTTTSTMNCSRIQCSMIFCASRFHFSFLWICKRKKNVKCFFYNVWNKEFAKRNIDLRIWNLTKVLFFEFNCFFSKFFNIENHNDSTSSISKKF